MTPLALNRQWLKWLSVYPPESSESQWKQIAYSAVTLIVLISFINGLIGNVYFCVVYVLTDLEQALYGASIVFALLGSFYILLISLMIRKRITAIFSKLSYIYDLCKFHLNSNSLFHHA